MDWLLSIVEGLGVNVDTLIVLVVGIIGWILERIAKGKYKHCLDDAMMVSRAAYSAIEEADNKEIKELVSEALTEIGKEQPGVLEVNDTLMKVVDNKTAKAVVKGNVPPIKRFWRRFLAGKNLVGVLARVAAKAFVKKQLDDLEDTF